MAKNAKKNILDFFKIVFKGKEAEQEGASYRKLKVDLVRMDVLLDDYADKIQKENIKLIAKILKNFKNNFKKYDDTKYLTDIEYLTNEFAYFLENDSNFNEKKFRDLIY